MITINQINKLNNNFLPMVIKIRIIKEIKSNFNNSSMPFNNDLKTLFSNVKSSKVLRAIGEIMQDEIINSYNQYVDLPLDVWNNNIVNSLFNNEYELQSFIINTKDKEKVNKVINLLSSDNKNNFLNSLKRRNLYFSDNEIIGLINNISNNSFLDELLNNLNLQYVVPLINNEEVSTELKNKILKDRNNEIINFLRNNNNDYYYNEFLSSNIDEKYKNIIISSISRDNLLLFMKRKVLSDEIKEKIYNDRFEELDILINEEVGKCNSHYKRILDDKNMYPTILEEIIKRVDIDTLIYEIKRNSISKEMNDLIANFRSNDLETFFISLPENNFNLPLLTFAFNNHLISDNKFLQVLNNLDINYLINYLIYNELPSDLTNKIFDSCKDRIYNLLNDKSKNNYFITNLLLLKNLPEDVLTNIILRLDKNIVYDFFKRIRTNTKLKEKIYELRKDDINESINTSIKEYYKFLIDDSLSKEDIMAIISNYDINSLSSLLPIYNIVDRANISPDEFIINSDYFFKICYILKQDDIFIELNSASKDEQERIINSLNRDDLFELFFNRIESSYLKYKDEKERETLRLIYNAKKEDIINYCDKNIEKYNLILSIVPVSDVEEIINKFDFDGLLKVALQDFQSEHIKRIIIQKLTSGIDNHGLDFCEIVPYIKNNADIFIKKFEDIYKILEGCLPNVNTFFKHALFDEIDFVGLFNNIIENNKNDNFVQVCKTLLGKLYNTNEDNLMLIESFLKILKNYNKYPELCNNIANINRELTRDEILKIEYLFDKEGYFNEIAIKEIDDIDNLTTMINSQINNVIENIDNYDIKTVKNIICSVLFNYDVKAIEDYLSIYGNVLELKKLKFNNRDNPQIFDLIDEMIIYVSIMEDIININDKKQLLVLLNNISSNYNVVSKLNTFFSQFDKRMKHLYEVDSQINLTNINSLDNYNDLLNTELTKKYGVDVLDFSDRQYVLYGHVKSDSENVEELVNGKSSGSKNFICLSPISYRGQNYYGYGSSSIIFGYDVMPDGNFICSSKLNMGSNGAISRNSNRVDQIVGRTQRGILESTDNGINTNPETLSFREGLKSSCIIIPKNWGASTEYFEIAKKYGLKVILTQESGKSIENPKPLNIRNGKSKERGKEIADLKFLKEKLLNAKKNTGLKKIAILPDPHSLYEPTLAILEDARKEGITEIYSLGDNIGTGPNPGEVVDLLENYNVKSVLGNHELYTLLGTKSFEKHLRDTGATEEAENNSRWTRAHLSDKQLETIRNYPEQIVLDVGGKKVLLKHSVNDFNTGNIVINPDNYDKIFQGHIHLAMEEGKIETLRGAGIGYSPSDLNTGEAYYIILSESKDGGFDIERKKVSFDLNNLRHNINVSDLDIQDKEKISSWTSSKSIGR